MIASGASLAAVVVGIGTLGTLLLAWSAGRDLVRVDIRSRLQGDRVPSAGASAPVWFGSIIKRLALPVDPVDAWLPALAITTVASAFAVAIAPLLVVVVGSGALVATRVLAAIGKRTASERLEADLIVAIDRMVAALASGKSLQQALDDAESWSSTVALDLSSVGSAHRQGRPLQQGLDRWAGTKGASPGGGAALMADALALAGSTGGSMRKALDGVSNTLRERQALRREVRALGAQARASALVLVVAPIAFSAVVAVVDSRVGEFLIHGPLGWSCVVGGLALDAVGGWWMGRLIGAVR